ncbi:MAG: bile acid:sodium symporter family protein [Myxococcales bacterium]|nr:bile acid:sodium symporter family protein [Myxococcales bacterium]
MTSFQHFAETVLVPVQLVLTMLGMGATLAPGDFRAVVTHPAGIALGLVLQLVVAPALAVVLTYAFGLGPGFAVGMVLIAAVPGGAVSNLLTFLGRGNVPLSIAMTTASTLGCVITAPLLLRLLAAEYLPDDFALPVGRLLGDIASYLFAPLALGMIFRRFVPKHAQALCDWSVRLSVVVILLIAGSSLGSGRVQPFDYGPMPLLAIIAFTLLHAYGTPHVVRLLGRSDADAVALSVEVTVRNLSIGLLLVGFFFPGEPEQAHVLYACLVYSGVATPVVLPVLYWHRRGRSPALGRRPSVATAPAAPSAPAP